MVLGPGQRRLGTRRLVDEHPCPGHVSRQDRLHGQVSVQRLLDALRPRIICRIEFVASIAPGVQVGRRRVVRRRCCHTVLSHGVVTRCYHTMYHTVYHTADRITNAGRRTTGCAAQAQAVKARSAQAAKTFATCALRALREPARYSCSRTPRLLRRSVPVRHHRRHYLPGPYRRHQGAWRGPAARPDQPSEESQDDGCQPVLEGRVDHRADHRRDDHRDQVDHF